MWTRGAHVLDGVGPGWATHGKKRFWATYLGMAGNTRVGILNEAMRPPALSTAATCESHQRRRRRSYHRYQRASVLLGRVAVCTAKAAYSHRPFPLTICVVSVTDFLSVQCIVAIRLNRNGCGLEW